MSDVEPQAPIRIDLDVIDLSAGLVYRKAPPTKSDCTTTLAKTTRYVRDAAESAGPL
jgi:hypothetical protein